MIEYQIFFRMSCEYFENLVRLVGPAVKKVKYKIYKCCQYGGTFGNITEIICNFHVRSWRTCLKFNSLLIVFLYRHVIRRWQTLKTLGRSLIIRFNITICNTLSFSLILICSLCLLVILKLFASLVCNRFKASGYIMFLEFLLSLFSSFLRCK